MLIGAFVKWIFYMYQWPLHFSLHFIIAISQQMAKAIIVVTGLMFSIKLKFFILGGFYSKIFFFKYIQWLKNC